MANSNYSLLLTDEAWASAPLEAVWAMYARPAKNGFPAYLICKSVGSDFLPGFATMVLLPPADKDLRPAEISIPLHWIISVVNAPDAKTIGFT